MCFETQNWGKKLGQVTWHNITIDNDLKFDDHITKTCHKANSKLKVLYLDSLDIYIPMKHKKLL